MYQIEVWRKSKASSGYLIVSANDNNIYYQAQNEAVKFDKDGWELLIVKVKITPEIAGKTLKIYLWNPRFREAYFDDLSIKKYSIISDNSTSDTQ